MKNMVYEVDGDGIGLAVIDMPGRVFNVFSDDMIDELEALLAAIEQDRTLTGLVIASGKDAFMAGADLAMVRGFTTLRFRHDTPAIRKTFSRLSLLMRRLERLSIPTVAAVNGLALGGGLELAMACHHRVAVDSSQPALGLPEVLLGLLPGAGGTQRLPRLIGPQLGAKMLLDGKPVSPQFAHANGLVDHLAAAAELRDSARAIARRAAAGARWDRGDWRAPVDEHGLLAGAGAPARLMAQAGIDSHTAHLYPALGAICQCLIDGYGRSIDAAIEVEIDNFLPLMLDPVAGNMVRTSFLSKTAAAKRAAQVLGSSDDVNTLAVNPGSELPARFARRFEQVAAPCAAAALVAAASSAPTADFPSGSVIALRDVAREPESPYAVELRTLGDFDRVEAVEIAAAPGVPGAQALAIARRLRLVPVAVGRSAPGPSERMLTVVRRWVAAAAPDPVHRGRIARALDLGRLFTAAGCDQTEGADHDQAARTAGLQLMVQVATEAARSLADGQVGAAEDIDVLAVTAWGFPAWSGGPLSFLDMLRRGEVSGCALPDGLPEAPFYRD